MPKDYSRKSRVNIQIQRELTGIIRQELTDPRVANVTVTRVEVSPDLRNCKVYISVLDDESRIGEAAITLNRASGRLRHGLGQRLTLRHVPQLHFTADLQMIQANRLNHLIRDAIRSDEGNSRERDADDAITGS